MTQLNTELPVCLGSTKEPTLGLSLTNARQALCTFREPSTRKGPADPRRGGGSTAGQPKAKLGIWDLEDKPQPDQGEAGGARQNLLWLQQGFKQALGVARRP